MTRAFLPLRRPAVAAAFALLFSSLFAADRAHVVVKPAEGEKGIHAALASLPMAGGVVELEAGNYRLTEPIMLDRDDIELRGRGRGPDGTLLVLADGANCPAIIIGRLGTRPDRLVHRIVVSGLLVDGNREQQSYECWGGPCNEQERTSIRNNGITIRGVEDVQVRDITIRKARSGGVVLEKHCRRVKLERLEAYENEFDGVAAYETEDSDFVDLNLYHNRSAGFSFDWRFNRNRVVDCVASSNGSQGIFMRDSVWNVIERVKLQNNGEQGVFMAETRELPGTACRYNRLANLTITGNRTQGIRINDRSCNPNTLEDSFVKYNRLEDLSLADFGQLQVLRPREKE